MSPGRWPRRAFLVRAFLLATAAALPGCGGGGGRLEARDLAAWLPDDEAVLRLGRAWLEARPTESGADETLALLDGAAGGLGGSGGRQRLLAVVRDDYRSGRTVLLLGWVLSETEARLCGVAARVAAASGSGRA